MKFTDNTFINLPGAYYPQILSEIKKNPNVLQPIYEAFTNSLESIYLKQDDNKNNSIIIKHYLKRNLLDELEFDKTIIEDTGKGFDDKEFERFNIFKDSRKGFKNKGSGRIQLAHFFNNIEYSSIFKTNDSFMKRNFTISKSRDYVHSNNTITFLKFTQPLNGDVKATGTSLLLSDLLEDEDKKHYNFNIEDLKENIINHYLMNFCLNRNNLPKITLEQYVNNDFTRNLEITQDDIPKNEQTFEFNLNYSLLSGYEVKILNDEETFKVTPFRIPKASLLENEIKLTSKNEIIELKKYDLELTNISAKDNVDGDRFLFLISSKYLDNRDSDVRGELRIPSKKDLKKDLELFSNKEIFIEDIGVGANESILYNYEEIQNKVEEKLGKIEELKSMFLLNDDFLKGISISLNDSEEKILQKVYVEESKQVAKLDSKIKYHFEQLDNLDPSSKSYQEEFEDYIVRLVKDIPLQNRKALTHYVARRNLVLELFNKILKRKLKVQNDGSRNNDESLIHNLIFKQHSDNTDISDLWLLEEDFILFDGSSEHELKDVELEGNKIFKDDKKLSKEELEFRDSLNEKRYQKRPDILLFPDEGKCIIIEFKAPDVNVSDYINQIQNYATLIRNFSREEFQFKTFYGYLLGEKINTFDVKAKDPDFNQGHKFDYLYRPSKTVAGLFNNRDNGSLYMEIMKYSTLYDRAKNRNDVFIKKLTQKFEDD
ncbi:hypothetical protein GCM10011344_43720 [Dokdonia pacifica]|uniref:Histidine kinase-, DNA gyrase B-, and HSP90-like ATPase n=1 Tax=Dokdonia pacifica TaxID=1627892 RepID=A0A239AD49_9FLAO|nr:hypothetical protein [Dokdonia pacifica]GGG38124.1 hypothetical protein GCM10011344_43720 [Dokdonia pacifica]SNR93577.1 hypothetical protein SAMN06265376_104347 [Dokdonia pacifica]